MAIPRSPASAPSPAQANTQAASGGQSGAGGKKIFRELFGLSLLFWGLFVLLTLITYNSQDPGINHVVSATVPISNSGGMFGAHVSGLLVDLFGFAAFVWPLIFLAWGAGCVSTWFTMPWWRWFGFFALGACFVTLGSAMSFGVGDVRGGGMLGASLYNWGRLQFSPAGSGLIWLFMLFISLELAFGIQWLSLLQRGYGAAKETAEANDITLARIMDTVKRYAPMRKNDEQVIALLDITVDDNSVQPPPLSYADTVGAALSQEAAAAAEAAATAAAAAAAEASARAEEARLAQLKADQLASQLRAEAELQHASQTQATSLQTNHMAAQAALASFSGAQPVNLQAPAVPAPTSPVTITPIPAATVAPSSPLPDGFLGQARPVDLRSPTLPGMNTGARGKQQAPGKLASLNNLPDVASGLFGSLRGLFRKEEPASMPMPMPAPTITLHSIVPDPVQPEQIRPELPIRPAQPIPVFQPEVPQPVAPAPAAPVAPVAQAVVLHRAQADPVAAPVAPVALVAPAAPVAPAAQAVPVAAQVIPAAPAMPVIAEPYVAQPVSLEPALPAWAQPELSLPPLGLLQTATDSDRLPDVDLMAAKGEQLMACLNNFAIRAELVRITPGPVVTMFEIRPSPGTKVARIINLHQDLALALRAIAVRVHTIPGQDTLGIEIPNESRATVNFRRILESDTFQNAESLLTLALGADIGGAPVTADLAKMPHLLVGGATGSGKSVCINTLLLSLLYKAGPDDLKLLMVDPKVVELAMYADLPHLIHPVVTETSMAKNALEWAVHEMEERYNKLAKAGVRNIAGYNQKIADGNLPPDLSDLERMPYLVIVVDELSDLMLSAGKDVETAIVRLAQLARACGIHLIIATQRPSVDVVTGLIKANFPSRIAFQVTSAHDSRTILDSIGAELLLGKGDMLFKPSGSKPRRLHGPFASDEDVQAVVDYWKSQRAPDYALDFAEWGAPSADVRAAGEAAGMSDEEAMYGEIVQFALEEGKKLSISKLQRRFRIGFNKAARFMEQMQQDGIIQPAGHANRSRDIVN